MISINIWETSLSVHGKCFLPFELANYRGHDKRATSLQAVKVKMTEQFNDSFINICVSILSFFIKLSLDLCSVQKVEQ